LPISESSSRQTLIRSLVGGAAIVLAFAAVHGGQVSDNFGRTQWEDHEFIHHNRTNIHSITDCFTKASRWPGLYRPLSTNLYYYLGDQWFNNNIHVYHAINVAFYLINALVLFWICRFLVPEWWALAPPVLWVSRYTHVEVVSNTCEFQGLLAAFFTLLSFGLFIRARIENRTHIMILSVAAFLLALLSKETTVVLPGILLAFCLLYDRDSVWKCSRWHIGAAAVWGLLFAAAFYGHSAGFKYDFSPGNIGTNLAAYLLVFSNLLTYPITNVVMDAQVAATAEHWISRLAVLGLATAAGVYAILHTKLNGKYNDRMRPLAFGLLFFIGAATPYLVLQGRLFMRYSYLPHAGLAIAVTIILRELALFVWGTGRRLRPHPRPPS